MASPDPPDDPTRAGRAPAEETAHAPGRRYPFLSPPKSPDELGRLGDYRVFKLLGSGGMGFVFAAEELSLRRRVALKVLRPDLAADPDHRERFLREARAAAAVESDHVVTIYHVADKDVPFLVMPLLDGCSLQARLEAAPLTLREALEVGRQTARGLAAAHRTGLVHRDIKPANLWLERLRNDGRADPGSEAAIRVKILDFGLARRSTGETSLTSTGFIVGTPNYMAPEQASGLEVDGRADLFSLGVVLYTLLTGQLPFQGGSAMAVMMALASKTPPRVDAANPAVPPPVADLVARLLEKEPAGRPQSAAEVAAALDAAVDRLDANFTLPSQASGAEFVAERWPGSGRGEVVGRPATDRAETPAPSSHETYPAVPKPGGGSAGPRRTRRRAVAAGVALAAVAALGYWAFRPDPEPIPVGILHSQTGTMAVSELPLIDATVLAIEEVNAAGGVLGRPLRPVIVDGKSDPAAFQAAAERLIGEGRAPVIFGCMTSPSRKAVKAVVERDNGLLFFPVSYEGLEQSPRIVYVGAAPNQKFLPGVDHLVTTLGKRRLFYLGSDLVSPRAAAEVVADHLKATGTGAEIVGRHFVPLGSADVKGAIDAIRAADPDAVVNVLNGGSNFAFYDAFRAAGFRPATTPTLSISLTEHDLVGTDPREMAGDFLAANYFQSLRTPASEAFIRKVKDRFGETRVVTDNMVAAYAGVHLWARAAARAGAADPEAVARAVGGVEFDGPGGRIKIDGENRHAWRWWRVGRVEADGTVRVVAESRESVRADPFPASRSRREWDRLLNDLFVGWGGRWQAPEK